VHKKTLLILLALAIVFDFTGCSSMSAQARRERAYRHYVAKQMKHRQRELARAQKAARRNIKQKMRFAQPSEPMMTTTLGESSPQAMSAPQSTEPMSEPVRPSPDLVVAPITVSPTGSTSNETIEPSQP